MNHRLRTKERIVRKIYGHHESYLLWKVKNKLGIDFTELWNEIDYKSLVYGDVFVEILDKDHAVVKKKIKEAYPPYFPSSYSFSKQYSPDSLKKYERLGSSIKEVIDYFCGKDTSKNE